MADDFRALYEEKSKELNELDEHFQIFQGTRRSTQTRPIKSSNSSKTN